MERATFGVETHAYDGKMADVIEKNVENGCATLETINGAVLEIQSLAIEFGVDWNATHDTAIQLFKKMEYDTQNKIVCADVFVSVWRKVRLLFENVETRKENVFILQMFCEQLSDIVLSGPCAQGQTTRMLNFFIFV